MNTQRATVMAIPGIRHEMQLINGINKEMNQHPAMHLVLGYLIECSSYE